jgi:hypothetical protein
MMEEAVRLEEKILTTQQEDTHNISHGHIIILRTHYYPFGMDSRIQTSQSRASFSTKKQELTPLAAL